MDHDGLIRTGLVFARLAGLAAAAPSCGHLAAGWRLRAGLAALLAVLVLPCQWQSAPPRIDGTAALLLAVGGEAIIGAFLGIGVAVFLHGMTLAGELVWQTAGLPSAAAAEDDFADGASPLGKFAWLLGAAVFLCLGGHRLAMAGLLDSFRALPPGGGCAPESLLEGYTTLLGQSFSLGIRVAAPALAALLLATVALGLVSRTLPQLNLLSVGLGLNGPLACAAVALTIGAAAWALGDRIAPTLDTIFKSITLLGR
jgi:flagellar biosynthetic protein FliR